MYRGDSIVGVVEASNHTSPLPEATPMTSLCDRPLVAHVLRRLATVDAVDELLVVTTTDCCDDALAEYLQQLSELGVQVFRGPPEDPLMRCYLAIQRHGADVLAHTTAADLLVSPRHLRAMIRHLVDHQLDAVPADPSHTGLTPGFGAHVLHHQAIVDAHLLAARPDERREVSLFIRRHPCAFRLDYPSADPELCSEYRLKIEDAASFALVRRIYRQLYRRDELIDGRRVVELLERRPELTDTAPELSQDRGPAA